MSSQADSKRNLWHKALWQSAAILIAGAALGLVVNTVRPGGIPLLGSWTPAEQVRSSGLPDTTVISLDEAQVLFFTQRAIFVDARAEPLYREGHIQGAVNLPWEDFDQRVADFLQQVPRDAVLITYCDGEGCSLSKELAIALLASGYPNVHILVNGWSLWIEANLPIEQRGS